MNAAVKAIPHLENPTLNILKSGELKILVVIIFLVVIILVKKLIFVLLVRLFGIRLSSLDHMGMVLGFKWDY